MYSLTRITIIVTLLLGAAISTRAQSLPSGPTAGSSISGRVTRGGNPAPGLTVGAQRNDANSPSSSEPAAKATTDEDGRYRITGLAPGRYRVMSLSTVYVVPGDVQISSLSGKTVTLNESDQADNIDFSVVRGAVITGKVTDAEGRPLIGERVTLTSVDDDGRKRPFQTLDFTMFEIDDRGVYRIFGMPAGRYTISAGLATDGSSIRPGFGGATYRRTFHPNATDEDQAKVIEVSEGQEAAGIDINVGRPIKTYEASGRFISAETGQPMPNLIFGYGPLREGTNRPTSFGSSSTPTNMRGEFRIDNLLPGRHAAFLYNFGTLGDANSDYYSDPAPFEISDGNVSGIEIKVHRASSISGVVVAEDGNDQALLGQAAQAMVFASPVVTGPASAILPMPIISTDRNRIQPDGSFRVGSLSPGKVRLSLSGSGLHLVRIEREGNLLSNGIIELAPGEQVSGLRLVISFGTGVVRGEVKITGGTLPQGTRLMVSARRVTGDAAGTGSSTASAEADARGRFLLEKLPPGEYELTARVMPSPNIVFTSTATSGGSMSVTSVTTSGTGTGTGAGSSTSGGPLPQPSPMSAMPSVKQNVTVANGVESPVTMTLDLSARK